MIKRAWPYVVAAVMIAYVVLLAAMVKADVAQTATVLGLS